MKNKELCTHLIEQILHIQIKDIHYLETEKNVSVRLDSKSIRLDVYVEDEQGTVLDIEMQTVGNTSILFRDKDETTVLKELPLRTRYYQSMISMDMLRKGMKYRDLQKSYVIFICTFDPFGKGLPLYSFRYRSKENSSLELGDLTENIFLNAKAEEKVPDTELSAFLSYVNGNVAKSTFTQAVDREAERVKNNNDWRNRVMTWEMDVKIMCEDAAKKKAIEIAKSLLKDGMPIPKVAEHTNLTIEEVTALT